MFWAVCEGPWWPGVSELILSIRGSPTEGFAAEIKTLDLIFKGYPWRLVGRGRSLPRIHSKHAPLPPGTLPTTPIWPHHFSVTFIFFNLSVLCILACQSDLRPTTWPSASHVDHHSFIPSLIHAFHKYHHTCYMPSAMLDSGT